MAIDLSNYNIVYEDHFNDDTIDNTNWEILTQEKYSWLQCATQDNVYIEDGKLITRLLLETCPGDSSRNYTNGMVRTKKEWLYGYFEIRAKVAPGEHINNAFWMIRKDWYWPPEIDIYETQGYKSAPIELAMSYHYLCDESTAAPGRCVITNKYIGPDFSLEYHTYGVEWTPYYVRWIIDGVERARVTGDDAPIINVPMIILLSIGKGWGSGDPSISPSYHYIDYVRVYQKPSYQWLWLLGLLTLGYYITKR